jgi:hypothetical protein
LEESNKKRKMSLRQALNFERKVLEVEVVEQIANSSAWQGSIIIEAGSEKSTVGKLGGLECRGEGFHFIGGSGHFLWTFSCHHLISAKQGFLMFLWV